MSGLIAGEYYTSEIKLKEDGTDSSESLTTYHNFSGEAYKRVDAAGATTTKFFNGKGQLYKQVDPDGVMTLYDYNDLGELEYTTVHKGSGETKALNSEDRIIRTVRDYYNSPSHGVVLRTRTYLWPTNNVDTAVLASTVETSLNGNSTWQTTWNGALGLASSVEKTNFPATCESYVTTKAPDRTYSISHYRNGLLQTITRYDLNDGQFGQTTYQYDPFGRVLNVSDPASVPKFYTYDNANRITTITASSQVTSNHYNNMGRVDVVALPDNQTVNYIYYPTGELATNTGARIYPVEYGYDYAGRMAWMKTYQWGDSDPAITTWGHNNQGFLTSKTNADNTTLSYTYTPGGRLRTRTNARNITTTYNTNWLMEVAGISYSDGTPGITFDYDRLGRKTNAVDAAGTHILEYDLAGALISESHAAGLLNGRTITNSFDSAHRRIAVGLTTSASSVSKYTYDSASRLSLATNGSSSFSAYSYVANSSAIAYITNSYYSDLRMTVGRQYDGLQRLSRISAASNAHLFQL